MIEYYNGGKSVKIGLTNEEKNTVVELYVKGTQLADIRKNLGLGYYQARDYLRTREGKNNLEAAYNGEEVCFISNRTALCKECGINFKTKQSNHKYCSEECREKRYIKKPCIICGGTANVHNGKCKECRNKLNTRVCETCGEKFISIYNAKYCSKKCRKYSYKHRYEKICKYCNKSFKTSINETVYCSFKCYNASRKKSHRQFALELLEAHNGMIVPLGMYKGSDYEIECMCLKCGGKINKVSRLFIGANKTGCPNCGNKSNGEDKIREWLNTNNYRYAQQYSIDEVKDKHKLLFDFAVFKGNELICLIEYDGEQHFKPVDLWGGIEALENIIIRDNIKNEYCDKNKILLIRIPYTTKNISDELMKQVNNGK